MPLIIVVAISAIREAVEDLLRWRSDQRINALPTEKLHDDDFAPAIWSSLLVGDIVRITRDAQVPADVVLLSASGPDGTAYVQTANLDGETNLKVRQSLPSTLSAAPQSLHASVDCDLPNSMLYTFHGNLTHGSQTHPLDERQVLLRGCVLANTDWAWGVVVYTGGDTKLMRNASDSRTKRSRLEVALNRKLLSIFAWLLVAGVIGASLGYDFEQTQVNGGRHWYFGRAAGRARGRTSCFFILLVSCVVIINATIPISLYVTLEVVRVFQALFVYADASMFDGAAACGCVARTTTISDDLGQVAYVFSDKTGTLTQNVMTFLRCTVGGVAYGAADVAELLRRPAPPEAQHFAWLLATCHAVIPEARARGVAYMAASPDEGALVEGAAGFGYVLTGRAPHALTVAVDGAEVEVELLAALEFTSERKRSSVVIRHPVSGEIVLYCKGADDFVLARVAPADPCLAKTREHVQAFADSGLRTLCCAYRVLEPAFFAEWAERLRAANCAVVGREDAVAEVAGEVESELTLLGATAIEDKLQVGVPATIEALLRARIAVWVITGDKRETAINIGFACSLLSGGMNLIVVDSEAVEEIEGMLTKAAEEAGKLALVVSGQSLQHLLDEPLATRFYELAIRCQSVICCRASPLQKARVVALMREKTGKLALAIGDGANDVGMILQADVGVGVSGKEGRQAVLASDYSIAQFRFLRRLLLVHGRLNFYRNVDLINYSFYKNMACSFVNVLIGFFSSWSGITLYDSMLYMTYNVIFTSVPRVVYAGLERDLSFEAMENVPEMFTLDDGKEYFQSALRFAVFLAVGVLHALIAFFIPYGALPPGMAFSGRQIGLKEFGTTVYMCVVTLVNLEIAVMSNHWTWLHHVFYWLSIAVCPVASLIIDAMRLSPDMSGTTVPLLGTAFFWFSLIAVSILGLIIAICRKAFENARNTQTNRMRWKHTAGKQESDSADLLNVNKLQSMPET